MVKVKRSVFVPGVAPILAHTAFFGGGGVIDLIGSVGVGSSDEGSVGEEIRDREVLLGDVACPATRSDVPLLVSEVAVDAVDAVEGKGPVCPCDVPPTARRTSAVGTRLLEQGEDLFVADIPHPTLAFCRDLVVAQDAVAGCKSR